METRPKVTGKTAPVTKLVPIRKTSARKPTRKQPAYKEQKMTELEVKVKRMDACMLALENHVVFLKNKMDADKCVIKCRLENINDIYKRFEINRQAIDDEADIAEQPIYQEKANAFLELFYVTKAGLMTALEEASSGSDEKKALPAMAASGIENMRLPKVTIPEFSGKYDEWLPFRDHFISLVHNNKSLSGIQKMCYMRSSLKGEAFKVIDTFQTCEASYEIAWDTLNKRFNNEYVLKKQYVNALINWPKLKGKSTVAIHALVDGFRRHTDMLSQLRENASGYGMLLTQLLVSKLDEETKHDWEVQVERTGDYSNSALYEFLHSQTRILDAGAADNHAPVKQVQRRVVANVASSLFPSCEKCNEQHHLWRCEEFKNLATNERSDFVRIKKLCNNCLSPGHWSKKCKSRFRCTHCSGKHHTLLHGNLESKQGYMQAHVVQDQCVVQPEEFSSLTAASIPVTRATHVMLSTAIIKIRAVDGRWCLVKALLDNGAQVNVMTETLCRKLGLTQTSNGMRLFGVGRQSVSTSGAVSAVISARRTAYEQQIDFVIMPRITGYQPNVDVAAMRTKLPSGFDLADPYYDQAEDVDLLLGAEFFIDFLCTEGNQPLIRRAEKDLPAFVKTVFGWITMGKMPNNQRSINTVEGSICTVYDVHDLAKQIERFWSVDELPAPTIQSQEERDCEEHFQRHHRRDEEGRYIVKLPCKAEFNDMIGDSKDAALKRFLQLERRFKRDSKLRKGYTDVIDEYVERGYLKSVEMEMKRSVNYPVCYLPHHPVLKSSSSSTKIRPVFDGSAKTSSGFSLNDALLVGPVVQDQLLDLLLRFRMNRVALVADIEKMYLQVKVDADQTSLQRILWRSSEEKPIESYELQRVTFGLKPSSFLATRVLLQLAKDEGDSYPLAQKALCDNFYVDDFIGGANSEEEALQLQRELIGLLKKGGFDLKKWSSNKAIIMKAVPPEARGTDCKISFGPEEHIKALGVSWFPASDNLYITVNVDATAAPLTRRLAYSMVAKLFDPLGLIAPVISWAKIRMQHLWIVTEGWDDPLPIEIAERWTEFQTQLPLLSKLVVPRYTICAKAASVEFHCFVDASEAAYGACLYGRSRDKYGAIKTMLMAAKSRPSPLKRVSLARLELCSAVMGVKLWKRVSSALKMTETPAFFWTDSMVVLHWLRSPSYTWATYVANRVALVQEESSNRKWLHVKGSENPADVVSRGTLPADLLGKAEWFYGPKWLHSNNAEITWGHQDQLLTPSEDVLERKKMVLVTTEAEDHPILDKFSNYWKMLRVTALCLRFARLTRGEKTRGEKSTLRCIMPINLSELQQAKKRLIGIVQKQHFSDEVRELSRQKSVPVSSKIRKLRPQLDGDGLLRVGGRLELAAVGVNVKHPWILPSKGNFSRVLAESCHRMSLHGGPTATLSFMRREFWPLKGRTLVNHIYRNCVTCFRLNPVPVIQPPGQLPIDRITPSRPFSVVGIDYCGPVYLKPVHRRAAAQKAYIAVFVCFSVKAIHIELVEDLSTQSFLAAFRRFIARRGLPTKVYSDNGLYFQGANNSLRELYDLLKNEKNCSEIHLNATKNGIKWEFIPPRAPNFGGLWEAGVKATKKGLLKVIGTQRLSFGEMNTILTQVEAQLNSRPLTPMSEDPEELDVLTPGHFLIGKPLNAIPEEDITECAENRLLRYQLIQQIVQRHWKRWKKEYLSELHNVGQRYRKETNIKRGQMVLLKEEDAGSMLWPLGRIVEVYPGPDGIVRVVSLKTRSGIFKRPVSKVCLLPFERDIGSKEFL